MLQKEKKKSVRENDFEQKIKEPGLKILTPGQC